MKKELIYFMLFLSLASYSCLDSPDMTDGIANMKKDPTVETKTNMVFSNENFTLTIKGKVVSYGKESDDFRQGFCWGTDSTHLVDSIFFMKTAIDTFSYDLQNLDGKLIYYWRAVAKNQYGIALGEIRKYTTPSEEPSVVSEGVPADYFPADGALLFKGEILAYGKINDSFKKGFCWGLDDKNFTDSIFLENDKFEPTAFSYILSNARGNTTYYWKAFAINDYGASFGEIQTCKTPPIFTRDEAFNNWPRSNFIFFGLKNSLYISCGIYNGILYSETWGYDGRWNRTDDFPGSARRYPVAFTIDDSLAYVGTGQGIMDSHAVSFGDFYVFNGNTGTWTGTPIATPAEMVRHGSVAFNLNNKGYVVGGENESGVLKKDVWEYSVENGEGSWKRMNDFPEAFSGGISFYDRENVFAGYGNIDTKNTLWKYDATRDEWKVFADSPTYSQGGRATIRSGLIFRGKIYLLDVTGIIWEWDSTIEKYKQKSTLPEEFPLGYEQYMFSWGDAIYIGLGGTKLFYKYYPLWDN